MMRLWALSPVSRASPAIRHSGTFEYFAESETLFAAAAGRIQPQVSMRHRPAGGSSMTGGADERASCAKYFRGGLRRPLPDPEIAAVEKGRSSGHIDHGDFQPTAARGIHGIAVAARPES